MAHIAVERRSVSMEKWAGIVFRQAADAVIADRQRIDGWEVRSARYRPEGYQWEDSGWKPIREGDGWGGPDATCVFRCSFTVPGRFAGKNLWLRMQTPTEVIVSENGKYLDGLDPNRTEIPLCVPAAGGERRDLMLEAYTRSKPDDDRSTKTRQLRGCAQIFRTPELVVLDGETQALKYDLDMIYQTAFSPLIEEDVRNHLRRLIEELLKRFPPFECPAGELRAAAPALRAFIEKEIYGARHPFGKTGRLACVAHSHLDIAYHWTVDQTVQKNARTVLIQLRLMDRHPEFTYAHTQAWTYEALETWYPRLFRELNRRVAEGRWEIVGGMYVEPDCNLISAESLIRQILYGKRYFLEKFGVDVDNCWLPDVFGNSPIMPQILKKSGIDYFVSNKMSTWNDTNLFPHNNFIWRGIDGSEIAACVPPVHFITWMEPGQAAENWARYQEKESCPESLQMYGYGDGGSGVTDEMLEWFKRQEKLPGIPRMRLTTGKEYLHSAFGSSKGLATWDGDLYLEMHRGTFTTKAELKKRNRRGEYLARETESLMTMAALLGAAPARGGAARGGATRATAARELAKPWKKLLLNQFHDILPGSHTAQVTIDALETYDAMEGEFRALRERVLDLLAPSGGGEGEGEVYSAVNAFPQRRGPTAYLDSWPAADADADAASEADAVLVDGGGSGRAVQAQTAVDGGTRFIADIEPVSAMGALRFRAGRAGRAGRGAGGGAGGGAHRGAGGSARCVGLPGLEVSARGMRNAFFDLELDGDGRITGIRDLIRGKAITRQGRAAAEWQLFDDRPGLYNAWDIVKTYELYPIELPPWTNIEVVERGPLSAAVRMERRFGDSRAVQIIRIHARRPRIDFETWVDWREDQKLLKVAFPVAVKARTYQTDTSAGVLDRMNNRNTSWEQARFEVPCHSWFGVSDGTFGVAVLNDGKYGCDVVDDVLRLTLLRAPVRPDRESDRGLHSFTYSLFAHGGSWQADGLLDEVADLNDPLVLARGRDARSDLGGLGFSFDSPGVRCLAYKTAEDGSGDLVVRLLESFGTQARIVLRPAFTAGKAFSCDLLEREQEELTLADGGIAMEFGPWEIKTVRFECPT